MHDNYYQDCMHSQQQSIINPSIVKVLYFDEQHSIFTHSTFPHYERTTICLYFPQFRQVIYPQFTKEEQNMLLYEFVQQIAFARAHLFNARINLYVDKVTLKQFGNAEIIPPNALLRWIRSGVQVIFNKNIDCDTVKCKTYLQLRVGCHQESVRVIPFDEQKKMQVRDLLQFHNLSSHRFTSLLVKGSLIKHNQTMEALALQEKNLQVNALLAFQCFYHEMHRLYAKLSKSISFEEIVTLLTEKDDSLKKYLADRYKGLKSQHIDKATQLTIIYLTSPFYNAKSQKEIFRKFFNGEQLGHEGKLACLMVNKMQKLDNPGSFQKIYLAEKIEEQCWWQNARDEIIRLQTFSPAFKSIEDLLKFQKSKDFSIFEIDHLTAQYVGLYNNQIDSFNYIAMPYTEYLVEEVSLERGYKLIKLWQMQTPKLLDSNLVLWIDDKARRNRGFESSHLKEKDLGIQIIYFKSNKLYERWLQLNYNLLVGRQVRIITNMHRQEHPNAGANTIFLTRKYLNEEVGIMMYVGDVDKCVNILKENQVPNMDRILITNNENTLALFIQSLSIFHSIPQNECEVGKCQIY